MLSSVSTRIGPQKDLVWLMCVPADLIIESIGLTRVADDNQSIARRCETRML